VIRFVKILWALSVFVRPMVVTGLVCLLYICPSVSAQHTKASTLAPVPNKSTDASTTAAPTVSTKQSSAASATPNKGIAPTASRPPIVQGDYIPCKFTVTELKALVSPEIAS
jgi:hypothetical protein